MFYCIQELELLPVKELHTNVYIKHPVAIEQYLMEGSYNKVSTCHIFMLNAIPACTSTQSAIWPIPKAQVWTLKCFGALSHLFTVKSIEWRKLQGCCSKKEVITKELLLRGKLLLGKVPTERTNKVLIGVTTR